MSLDAIAALLGHKTLAMMLIYARVADKTVTEEYFAVTEKVYALHDQPRQLPGDDEGRRLPKLRSAMHCRMLGTAIVPARSRGTATLSPSAGAAAYSSPRSSSGRPCIKNARMLLPCARWVAERSSKRSSTAWNSTLREGPR